MKTWKLDEKRAPGLGPHLPNALSPVGDSRAVRHRPGDEPTPSPVTSTLLVLLSRQNLIAKGATDHDSQSRPHAITPAESARASYPRQHEGGVKQI